MKMNRTAHGQNTTKIVVEKWKLCGAKWRVARVKELNYFEKSNRWVGGWLGEWVNNLGGRGWKRFQVLLTGIKKFL
jgi:hypothetical protein